MSTVKPKHMLNKQLDALLEDETNRVANLSNASALLFEQLSEINWAGFYLWEDSENELVLGPFQGKVACVRIENGSGVCGTAFKEQKTYLVKDVHEFPGHIACDAASESEIVVPLTKDGIQIGVLDIDAPIKNRFTEEDQEIIEEFASVLLKHL
ncbi:GAF domain-containing protein [Marinilactibacillus piezotolerans]|uniref:GAF domain-containing protein n=1 Tax=Marinilactibacillus piezotolerans TaxID=258723 RepID=A0A1I3XWL8_9LACT|nr:GAF domain-containing protein [Marinilactibacillus piezotolerans]SFK23893.1 GAF domain-containing protein [Marinilactibacillus piezotolerans]